MWFIVLALLAWLPVIWLLCGENIVKLWKKFITMWFSVRAVFNFLFILKNEDRAMAFRHIHLLFPRFVHIDFLSFKVLLVYDPEIQRKIFNAPQIMQRPFRDVMGVEKGLLVATYAEWKKPRKHLNVAFNLNVLKGFIPIFTKYSDIMIQELQMRCDGDDFDILTNLAQLTFRTVAASIMSVDRVEFKFFEKVYDSMNITTESVFNRIVSSHYYPNFIYKLTPAYRRARNALDILMQYGNELIDEARKKTISKLDENENVAKDKNEGNRLKINFIVDQLINHEEKFSDREIRDHLLTLQLTASDTTTNLVAACLMYLSINQDIQQKVYDEILDVIHDDIDYESLCELRYLKMVLNETLRLFSPIPIMMRECFEDCDIGIEKTLKKDTKIFVLAYVLHQRKDIWGKDSRKFDPENFSPENTSNRNPYSFIPFGSGQRNCIGNQYTIIAAKVFIVKLLKAFKFQTKLTERDMKMKITFTGKLASSYYVSIVNRI